MPRGSRLMRSGQREHKSPFADIVPLLQPLPGRKQHSYYFRGVKRLVPARACRLNIGMPQVGSEHGFGCSFDEASRWSSFVGCRHTWLVADNIKENLLQVRLMLFDQIRHSAFNFQLAVLDDGDSIADSLDLAQLMGR